MATVDFVQDYTLLVVKTSRFGNKSGTTWPKDPGFLRSYRCPRRKPFLCSGPQAVLALTHAASRASLISREEWMAGKPPFSFACLQIAAKTVCDINGMFHLRLAMSLVFFFSPSICCNKVESCSMARAIFLRGAHHHH